jgi:hypothetical protein
MAYIVDLTIIMQMVFIISEGRADGVVKPRKLKVSLRALGITSAAKFTGISRILSGRWVYSKLLWERTLFWKRRWN